MIRVSLNRALRRWNVFPNETNAWLRNSLYYFTLIYVFSLQLTASSGLNLGIRPLEVALLPMCLVVRVTRISRWILLFLLYLAVSIGIGLARGTEAIPWAFTEYRAILINVLYYYFFFRLIRNDSDRAFLAYARIAFWFAVIAFPVWMGSTAIDPRLHGLATEPAQFCLLVLPAYYWYTYRFITARKNALEVAVFTLAIIFSESLLGYMSVAFGTMLLLSRRRVFLVVAPVLVAALLAIAYNASSAVRMRVDETLLAVANDDVTGSNLSTYSLISNAVVTQQVLKESPIIGNGLGSHVQSHVRFLESIPGYEYFASMNLEYLNRTEAGSLTFRVLSEFGILGYLGVLAFLFHFHVGGKGPRAAISNAILVCAFLKLMRSGEYYQPDQFFFIFIYTLNYRKFRRETSTQEKLPLQQKSGVRWQRALPIGDSPC